MANWSNINSRGNVEDRRSFGPTAVGGLGLGGILLVIALNFLGGGNLSSVIPTILNNLPAQTETTNSGAYEGADSYETFASTILGSNNDYWSKTIQNYTAPRLVLFRSSTNSACGGATSDAGPHYCPYDKTIYLDETFFDELQNLGGNAGDVAQAYVISHEVGHHVQNLLGTLSDEETNAQSIKTELQADCYAGLWAHSLKDQNVFEPGEIQEALDTAAAVGDDRIQKAVNGRVNPETWTHGSSADRVKWFTTGYTTGSFNACST